MFPKKMFPVILAICLLVTSCGGSPATAPATTVTPQPTAAPQATATQEPMAIKFIYDNPPAWRLQAERFTKATGIPVQYEEVPFPQLHTRYQTALLGGSYDFDVLHVMDMWVKEWGPKGLLLPLDDLITPEIQNDYPEGVLDNLSAVDLATGEKHLYGRPLYYWITNFYYRTDLFKEVGLEVPKTGDEMREAGRVLKEKLGIYGFSTAMQIPTNTWVVFLRGEGGEILDKNGKPAFNTAAGRKALDILVGMAKDGTIDPASYETNNAIGAIDLFTQGTSAMTFGPPPTFPMSADPAKSKVVGKIDVALMPGGSVHKTATYHETGGRAVAYNAKNPEGAKRYISWVTSPEEMVYIAIDPGLGRVPARKSALADPRVQSQYQLMKIVDAQLSGGPNGMAVVHEKGTEISDALGRHLMAAIKGQKTSQQALDDAEAEINKIIGS